MVSSEKESFPFETVCATEGAVENWLLVVETEMAATLHRSTRRPSSCTRQTERVDWVKENVGHGGQHVARRSGGPSRSIDVFNRVRERRQDGR